MNNRILFACSALSLWFSTACSSAHDVELSGEVKADAAVAADAAIHVDVYDVTEAGGEDGGTAAAKLTLVESLTLDQVGTFSKTVGIDGKSIHVVAYVDTSDDGSCTNGEAWGEADVDVAADADKAQVSVQIIAQATCPAVPAAN